MKGEAPMDKMLLAQANGRTIPKEDMIFAIAGRADQKIREVGKENVISGTTGALLDDAGNLMVLSSVDEVFHSLSPVEYAKYAPIAGTPAFKAAVVKSALHDYTPKGSVGLVASPGGTGALRLAFSNYTQRGDDILISDWHWGPYRKLASESGRGTRTFKLFDESRKFNLASFEEEVGKLAAEQECVMVVLNTPAQNPTGYTMSDEEWTGVMDVLKALPKDKKITVVADTAYIDFAGDEEEVRSFLPILDAGVDNIMPLMAFSLSKTFTIYGLRCGALIALAPSEAAKNEFQSCCEFTARACWSNCPRVGQSMIEKIFADEDLLARVTAERTEIRDMLLERGRVFEEEAKKVGLDIMPYGGGFFAVIPCDDAPGTGLKLEDENVFLIPFGDGLRVSLAALPMEQVKKLPAICKKVIG